MRAASDHSRRHRAGGAAEGSIGSQLRWHSAVLGGGLGNRVKELANVDIKNERQIPDLLVRGGRSKGFDTGEDIPADVAAVDLELGHQLVLRPGALIAETGDVSSDEVPGRWPQGRRVEFCFHRLRAYTFLKDWRCSSYTKRRSGRWNHARTRAGENSSLVGSGAMKSTHDRGSPETISVLA